MTCTLTAVHMPYPKIHFDIYTFGIIKLPLRNVTLERRNLFFSFRLYKSLSGCCYIYLCVCFSLYTALVQHYTFPAGSFLFAFIRKTHSDTDIPSLTLWNSNVPSHFDVLESHNLMSRKHAIYELPPHKLT